MLALREHLVDGRLTLGEFSQRVDAALRAVTADDLAATVESLPPGAAPSTRRQASWITAGLFSHTVRRGRLRLPRRTVVVSVFSDVDLDLAQCGDHERPHVDHFGHSLRGAHVYVPEGIDVYVTGLNVFGHRRERARDPAQPDAPRFRVLAFGLFATVDIWRVPDDVNGRYRDVIKAVRTQQRELSR